MAKRSVPFFRLVRKFVKAHYSEFEEQKDEQTLGAILDFADEKTKRLLQFQRSMWGGKFWIAMGSKDLVSPSGSLDRIRGTDGHDQEFYYETAEDCQARLDEALPMIEREAERLWKPKEGDLEDLSEIKPPVR